MWRVKLYRSMFYDLAPFIIHLEVVRNSLTEEIAASTSTEILKTQEADFLTRPVFL